MPQRATHVPSSSRRRQWRHGRPLPTQTGPRKAKIGPTSPNVAAELEDLLKKLGHFPSGRQRVRR